MKRKKAEGAKTHSASLVRASISFPPDLYETLEEIAKQKKVSLAWVVRDAVERYVADETEGENGQRQIARSSRKLARRAR
jgi:metal-responsive CopG/Arc/MetJ family transcriptional regulator